MSYRYDIVTIRTAALVLVVAAVVFAVYAAGLTVGYSGCVAQAGAGFTNNVMRGQ